MTGEPGRRAVAVASLRAAHAAAAARIRWLGLTVPSSLDVLAELRRSGVVASQRDVLDLAPACGLPLADARAEPAGRPVPSPAEPRPLAGPWSPPCPT